ncbi:MAG: heavy-metal-associated domain-containing protein [Planctomycetaceae bacterium]|nr:heavy-metal-associated domain-containing protein [Planctomycetales bacterium]MCB9922439.1 heavy-metal-associated domain-containing protein [Planctomycetaceae bacterium]
MKDSLSSLPGVASVTIDFPNKIAHCKVNPDEFDAEKAMEALAEIGFPATLAKDNN